MRESLIKFFPSVANRIPNIGQLKGKNILVVGASGLIGNHVLATLKETGCYIFILRNNNMPFVITDAIVYDWKTLFKSSIPFDYIIYLAGYGQPNKFISLKLNTLLLNTELVHKTFKLLASSGKGIYASSAEVYSGLMVEATENMIGTTTPDHPRACYAEGKRCGEAFIHAFNEYDRDIKIARIALSYGSGVQYNDTRVISDFIRMGLEDGVIRSNGGLSGVRTCCYVSDTVIMLLNIMLNGKSTVYNVGGDYYVTLRDILYDIAHGTNSVIEWGDENGVESAPSFVGMCMDKYYNEFHIEDDFILTNWYVGLSKTIEWFKYLKDNK